jgi:hypothetical protein
VAPANAQVRAGSKRPTPKKIGADYMPAANYAPVVSSPPQIILDINEINGKKTFRYSLDISNKKSLVQQIRDCEERDTTMDGG